VDDRQELTARANQRLERGPLVARAQRPIEFGHALIGSVSSDESDRSAVYAEFPTLDFHLVLAIATRPLTT